MTPVDMPALRSLANFFSARVPGVAWICGGAILAIVCSGPAQGATDSSSRLNFTIGTPEPATPAYVGDAACQACHEDKTRAYHRTAHANTTSLASADSIHADFRVGANILRTANPNLYFLMEAKGAVSSQTAVLRTSATEVLTRTEQIDIVVGSGRKGQTYLFWDDDQLYQLPVSHWTELGAWVNSPGYVDGVANFERPTTPRCLECHASSFKSLVPPINRFKRVSLVLGISCEKCHGPGREHVARYQSLSPPHSAAEAAIINPARLSRDRQMDICALCHAGPGESRTPPLSFGPGDVLARHLVFAPPAPDAHVDVHGSQVQLLGRSRCFQSNPTMTCVTCHDIHQPQRDLGGFASRCRSCHQVENCRMFSQLAHGIDRQCITCHMPLQETAQIISSVDGRRVQPKVRNHQIGIYPEIHLP